MIRRMKQERKRVYGIVQKGSNLYIPIKAKKSPYESKDKTGKPVFPTAYLACLPNFFGGVVDAKKKETEKEALIREVREESQDIIQLTLADIECLKPLYENNIGEYHYQFFLIQVKDNGVEYFPGNICELDCNADIPKEKREMSCMIKVPVGQLKEKILDAFLGVCKTLGGDFVNIDEATKGYDGQREKWMQDTGTKDAFACLLQNYAL